MSIVIACGFHSRFQQLMVYDGSNLSRREVRLEHADRAVVAAFYEALPPGSVVLLETTAFSRWFTDLLWRLKVCVKVGDAAQLAAMRPRKQKTDRRDAEQIKGRSWPGSCRSHRWLGARPPGWIAAQVRVARRAASGKTTT